MLLHKTTSNLLIHLKPILERNELQSYLMMQTTQKGKMINLFRSFNGDFQQVSIPEYRNMFQGAEDSCRESVIIEAQAFRLYVFLLDDGELNLFRHVAPLVAVHSQIVTEDGWGLYVRSNVS